MPTHVIVEEAPSNAWFSFIAQVDRIYPPEVWSAGRLFRLRQSLEMSQKYSEVEGKYIKLGDDYARCVVLDALSQYRESVDGEWVQLLRRNMLRMIIGLAPRRCDGSVSPDRKLQADHRHEENVSLAIIIGLWHVAALYALRYQLTPDQRERAGLPPLPGDEWE